VNRRTIWVSRLTACRRHVTTIQAAIRPN
jgi:hypothetical protein